MIKVSLISFTDDALNLLLRTKNTRLSYAEDPSGWSEKKKAEHLGYMLRTIKSSFEFVDYVFRIEGVTRAFTHELVRHRHGSYAQQSMRVVDARAASVSKPEFASELHENVWDNAVETSLTSYGLLVDSGMPIQHARGLLPTNVETSIIAKFNLRSLHEMMKIRLCTRAAKEFQDVMRAVREVVLFHHPWADEFLQVHCVAEGTCAFENYGPKDCPVWFPELDRAAIKATARHRFWSLRYEATPVAKEGKAV